MSELLILSFDDVIKVDALLGRLQSSPIRSAVTATSNMMAQFMQQASATRNSD